MPLPAVPGAEIEVSPQDLGDMVPSEEGPLKLWAAQPLRGLHEVCRVLGEAPEQFGPPGATQREDWSLSDRVRFCEWYRERAGKLERPRVLLELASRMLRKAPYRLTQVLEQEASLRQDLALKGLTTEGEPDRAMSHLSKFMRPRGGRNKGMRKSGAGRTAALSFLYPVVKTYFEDCRQAGVSVYPADLEGRLVKAGEVWLRKAEEQLSSGKPLSREDERRLKLVRERLGAMSTLSKHARRWVRNSLQRFCEARVRKPQRLVPITLRQEKFRCVVSWRAFDELMYLAMGHDEDFLKDRLVSPEEWMSNIEKTCILMSDQVPFWVKVSGGPALYGAKELQRGKGSRDSLEETPGQIVARDESTGAPMLRQSAIPEHSRYRVTLELTQCLSGWFQSNHEQPKAGQLKPALIVSGAYGRLSNIDPEGRFIKPEAFVVRGETVSRRAGESAGNLMQPWRELRDHGTPEDKERMKGMIVMSQPAGFVDGVIMSWLIEDLSDQAMACRFWEL